MNDREEFEKGSMIGCALETPLSANDAKILHEFLAAARQPEIDALKGKLNSCVDTVCRIASGKERLKNEIAALKAENERLREAAERATPPAQETRPDNSGLRKAAKELLKQLDWACDIKFSGHENIKAYYKAARELRVALEGK